MHSFLQHILILILSLQIMAPLFAEFSPDNTVLLVDLDEVVLQESMFSTFNIIKYGIQEQPLNSINYLAALYALNKKYNRNELDNEKELFDKDNNKINGAAFHFLYHGSQDEKLLPYVEGIVKTLEESRCFIDGTKEILSYLKHTKRYTIAFATNKDRISYDYVASHLGTEFTDLADKVFVAQPGNNEAILSQLKAFAAKESTPQKYKDFLERAITVEASETIHHIPHTKPDSDYYNHTFNTWPNKQHLLIDDRLKNTEGFNNALGQTSILFTNPAQLVDDLVRHKILSEQNDHALLEKIRYPGIMGKIRLWIKKMCNFIYAQA